MLFSREKISCFRAKARLAFHWLGFYSIFCNGTNERNKSEFTFQLLSSSV